MLEDWVLPEWIEPRRIRNWLIVAAVVVVILAVGGVAFGLIPALTAPPLLAIVAAAWWLNRVWTRRNVMASRLRLGVSTIAAVVAVGLVIQLIPYGRDHSLGPVSAEPPWDSVRTRELAARACFDCHSNEVSWPWYSYVAPISWSVASHVDKGRDKLNYSEWDRSQDEADESAETVEEGSMPPFYYKITHSGARLSDAEQAELIRGLVATFGEHREDD